jgi:hypothetical protein
VSSSSRPSRAEVEEREAPVIGQEHVPAVRVGVVDALHHDLEHVGAEELARQERAARSGSSLCPASTLRPGISSRTSAR